tara:strand:- start:3037 stop:3633 length:597 start_codon:yes stop_codon:yes gene_type:complete
MTRNKPTFYGLFLVLVTGAAMASAQPLTEPPSGKQAQKMMFSPERSEVEMIARDFLTPENAALLEQVAAGYAYYAAVAVAPDEELLKSAATMLVANHHSVEAASAAALEGCDKARTSATPCEVVAIVRPKGWKARDLQLSVEATRALMTDYGRKGPRAMAISPSAGFFGLGQGENATEAALDACRSNGANDCVVVVQD